MGFPNENEIHVPDRDPEEVRSLDTAPEQIVVELPDDLLTEFTALAKERYGATDTPVAYLANESMDRLLHAAEMREIPEDIELGELVISAIVDAVAENSQLQRREILQYCTQKEISDYLSEVGDSSIIQGREKEIADALDRDGLWPKFKLQAYKLHGECDEAVIRHIRHAMILIVFEDSLSSYKSQVERLSHISRRLQDLVSELTDFDLKGLNFRLDRDFESPNISQLSRQNHRLDDWMAEDEES